MAPTDAKTPPIRPDDEVPSNWAESGIERRRQRHAQRQRRNRQLIVGFVVGIAVVVIGGGGAALALRGLSSHRTAPYVPVRSDGKEAGAVIKSVEQVEVATPYFAQHGDLRLRLPVSVSDLTEVGFHQASYAYAVKMSTKLPDASSAAAKKDGGTGRDKSAQSTEKDAWLNGSVLRMWRSRPGKPNTAADIGARAGAQVLSPVDGRVLLVKSYKLYDKYADYEIHIRPDAAPDLDLVMIHVDKPVVRAGDRVIAGISPIAVVRKLSDRITHQLGHYSGDPGDHTHLQLNDTTDPKYKGLDDAPPLDGS